MDPIIVVTLLIAFFSSVLSGMAGVGGGFIMAPYWLLIGLTPAQAAANGSFMALGMGASSLAAFRKTDHFPRNKRLNYLLITITLIASALGAFILPKVDAEAFSKVLAVITTLSLPLLFVNKKDIPRSRKHQITGVVLLTALLVAGSIIFSSTFSILIAIVLASAFNMTVLQSTALRRLIALIQIFVLFSILAFQGNFVWQYALAGIVGGAIGSYLGTKIAIKKGEKFAKWALVCGALISAGALLV